MRYRLPVSITLDVVETGDEIEVSGKVGDLLITHRGIVAKIYETGEQPSTIFYMTHDENVIAKRKSGQIIPALIWGKEGPAPVGEPLFTDMLEETKERLN